MKKLFLLIITVMAIRYVEAREIRPVRIGLVTEGLSPAEEKAAKAYLAGQQDVSFVPLSSATVPLSYIRRQGITHIWWVKDAEAISEEEKKAGATLKQFVAGGGHLILSMEAVRLLHEWGIEKNEFEVKEDTVTDDGFGRPLGFHGYQDHPVYEGLHGGAYIWKGKEDHVARKIGFFGNDLPDTTICKVLGIGWSYITFHEDEKLVLEYRIGKGSVIAVGAYTYFSRPNFNTEELHRFYRNIFNYTAGNIKGIPQGFWTYEAKNVREVQRKTSVIKVSAATAWQVPRLSLQLERKEATGNFVNLAGRRMLLMGKERGGIDEIWTHPFMAFRDIQTAVQQKGSDSLIWLNKMKPEVIVSPEMLIRKYVIGADTLREMMTVAFDKPLGVLHYEWTGSRIGRVWIKFTSNLRTMWPYSDTSSPVMDYQWSEAANAAVVRNAHAGSESLIGFSTHPEKYLLGQYKDFRQTADKIEGMGTRLLQVSGYFGFNVSSLSGKFNVYLAGGCRGAEDAMALYKEAMPGLNTLYKKTSEYYTELLNTRLLITTPDKNFNEGYRWALVRTDQFLQTTPGTGTSLMAGYATTASGWNGNQAVSGRPGYAWYFGRDGEWSAMALDAVGGFEKVKQVLGVFVKYQAVNGKIFHELTSSGVVHYDASDATPLFVALAGHYLKYSGDIAYIKEIWPAIKKAMDFCYSTDTDHDGLIENTNVGHGWLEGGPLFGSKTEFYLAGCWAASLDAAGYIAAQLHFPDLQQQYENDSKKVKQIIDRDFWLRDEGYFSNGKMPDDSFMKSQTVLGAVPVLLGAVTDKKKAWSTASSFAGNNFTTDWGIQTAPRDNIHYDPGDYQIGMVRPLFSGYASLAEYKAGRYLSGFTHLMNNIQEYSDWALGSLAETFNGETYKPNGICALQAWCEGMALQPAIEGMLAYEPDARSRHLSLSPSFPWHWKDVKAERMRVGNTLISLQAIHAQGRYDYILKKEKGAAVSLSFSPLVPAGTEVSKVLVNGVKAHFSQVPQAEGLRITLAGIELQDDLKISVFYKGGIGVLPLVYQPKPYDLNTGAKIVGQHLDPHTYTIDLEGVPGRAYRFDVFSFAAPQSIENGTIQKINDTIYTVTTTLPESRSAYEAGRVVIHL